MAPWNCEKNCEKRPDDLGIGLFSRFSGPAGSVTMAIGRQIKANLFTKNDFGNST